MSLYNYFRKDNPFDYIVLGFIMKIVGNMAGFFMPIPVADAIFGLPSWIFIIKGFSKIPGKLTFPFKGGYRSLLMFYFLLFVVMIIRGYTIDYQWPWITIRSFIHLHFFSSTYWLCYLMPFTALIPIRYFNFRLILSYSIVFVFITLVFAFWFRNEIALASALGAMRLGEQASDLVHAEEVAFFQFFSFVPLLCIYIPSKKWKIAMLGLFIVIILMIIGARRGSTMLYTFLFVASLYFYTLSKSFGVRLSLRILIFLFLITCVYLIVNSPISAFLLERGLHDNRSGVEEAMLSQMDSIQLVFGKGLNGRYYYPLGLESDHWDGWRYGVETGFYNLVLKGGYLFTLTYILLIAIPAFKGIFKSKNIFCKAGGFYLLYSLFALWPFGILSFDLSFFYMWMMVSCCMNKKILKMSDNEIKHNFFYNLK